MVSYSESESKSDFSSHSDSESDNSVFINLRICIFLPYIYILNKLDDDVLSILITESIVIQAMEV